MARKRKPRIAKRRYSSLNEASLEKDQIDQGMKKLSDKLGSQWKKEELERFYHAYRKYGKDWEKVAADVGSRSVEMVEAIYTRNQAYLSLPEETASVVGLIATMTDHGIVLEESDSERTESDNETTASKDGSLSKLKRRRNNGKLTVSLPSMSLPRAVGKRTPRIPVKHSYRKDEWANYASSNKRNLESAFDANNDEVEHVEALTVTGAAQRAGSPKVSQIPYRRSEQKSSAVHRQKKMHQESKTAPGKLYDTSVDEACLEGSKERRGVEVEEYTERKNMEYIKDHEKGGNNYRKKEQGETVGNHFLDGGGATCSGTKEGLDFCLKEKIDIEATNSKPKKYLRGH